MHGSSNLLPLSFPELEAQHTAVKNAKNVVAVKSRKANAADIFWVDGVVVLQGRIIDPKLGHVRSHDTSHAGGSNTDKTPAHR